VKHGKARRIEIMLSARGQSGSLVIHDSGRGFQGNPGGKRGMGLDIMEHRSKMIGGSLEISSNGDGTTVACHFPTH
jgi:signal transduction histidine kinase